MKEEKNVITEEKNYLFGKKMNYLLNQLEKHTEESERKLIRAMDCHDGQKMDEWVYNLDRVISERAKEAIREEITRLIKKHNN